MNLSADLREVWKRLAASGNLLDVAWPEAQVFFKRYRHDENQWAYVCGSAMQGCKL